MDGLALDTIFSVNAKKILEDWGHPILLIRSSKETSPHGRSFFDTPDYRILNQDTNPAQQHACIDYYLDPDTIVLPLCKSGRNVRPEIVLGRHASSDICLADATLSKSHGWFIPPGKSVSGVIGAWNYVDNSSTNGTAINRHKILPQRPTMVRYGDELIMGNIHLLFLSKESIFDLIEYMQNEEKKTKRISRLF